MSEQGHTSGAKSGSARLVTWSELAAERPELLLTQGLVGEFTDHGVLGRSGQQAPTAVLRLAGAVVGTVGILFEDYLLASDVHYLPLGWDALPWSPYQVLGGGRYGYDFAVQQDVSGRALYVDTLVGVRNFSHFVRETLPYGRIQADLHSAGLTVPVLVPEWRFASQVALSQEHFAEVVRRHGTWVRVEELLVAPRQWCVELRGVGAPPLRVPADLLKRVARERTQLITIQESAPRGAPIYLWREWGAFGQDVPVVGRDFQNGSEVDECFRRFGYEFVDPMQVPVHEVLRKVAAAPVVAGLHGAQMAHILWANARATQIELIGPYGVSENHRALAALVGLPTVHLASSLTDDSTSVLDVRKLSEILDRLGRL